MSPPTVQTTVPHRDVRYPTLLIVAGSQVGRLYRCRRCGREVWSYFGRARRHGRYCRSRAWRGEA